MHAEGDVQNTEQRSLKNSNSLAEQAGRESCYITNSLYSLQIIGCDSSLTRTSESDYAKNEGCHNNSSFLIANLVAISLEINNKIYETTNKEKACRQS